MRILYWIDSTTEEQADYLSKPSWNLESNATDTPLYENNLFWADEIKKFRDAPIIRLQIALKHLPLPATFKEAAISLRAIIRQNTKKKRTIEAELRFLHKLAAVDSFNIGYSEKLQLPSYNIFERIPFGAFEKLDLSWEEIGGSFLTLLNKTDVKLMTKEWGEPRHHTTGYDRYREFWQQFEGKLLQEYTVDGIATRMMNRNKKQPLIPPNPPSDRSSYLLSDNELNALKEKFLMTAQSKPKKSKTRKRASITTQTNNYKPVQELKIVAIDFETADREPDSACALSLVEIQSGEIREQHTYLIKPPRDEFIFTYIHGITWDDVVDEPEFNELVEDINRIICDADYLAAHNASFDRKVLLNCYASSGYQPPEIPFLCTVVLARNTWSLPSNSLDKVSEHLNIELEHHKADSDALACAKIILAAHNEGQHVQIAELSPPRYKVVVEENRRSIKPASHSEEKVDTNSKIKSKSYKTKLIFLLLALLITVILGIILY